MAAASPLACWVVTIDSVLGFIADEFAQGCVRKWVGSSFTTCLQEELLHWKLTAFTCSHSWMDGFQGTTVGAHLQMFDGFDASRPH